MEKEITLEEFCEEVCKQIKENKASDYYFGALFNIYGMHFSEYVCIYKGSDSANLIKEKMYQLSLTRGDRFL